MILAVENAKASATVTLDVAVRAGVKLAYDEAWKRYSPGSILISYLMQYVIEVDKVEEIDFLTGNDAYKADWMTERRERWRYYCAKPPATKGFSERFMGSVKSLFKWQQRK